MPDVILNAEPRTEMGSGPAGRFRRAGRTPSVVYGLALDPITVTVPARELEHILHGASGANTLITLRVEGEDVLALARQIQRHPTRGELVHVDFVRIRRDVAVAAEVPLHVEGDAPGVKNGGLLEQLIFTVTVEAMPENIPTEIVVNISALELGDQLRVGELAVPEGVALQHEDDELVAQVTIPRGQTEEEEAAEAAAEAEAEATAAAAAEDGESGEAGGGE